MIAIALAMPGVASAQSFYSHPSRLAAYRVGQAIDARPARGFAPVLERAGRVLRFMYRSESATGAPRAETGLIVVPHRAPPRGGWRVIAWDHGTTGVGPACAPSRMANLSSPAYASLVARFAAAGYVVVAPDYEGLGLPGEVSPYAELTSEGFSTIDAVRAARDVVSHLGRRWVVVGHSQGGQAALGTAEAAATRAPGLPLVGTVAMAPASHLADALTILGEQRPVAVATLPEAAYLLLGAQVSDPAFDPAAIATPQVAAGLRLARTACYGRLLRWYTAHPAATLFRRPWPTSEPLRLFASRNDPGNQLATGPVLLAQGTADQTIPPPLTAALDVTMCSLGQTVDYRTFPGVTHNGLTDAARRPALAWIADRFDRRAARSNCASPAGGS